MAPAAASADSFANLQREQSIENAKLQKELDDARRIALEAERKVEKMAAAQMSASGAGPKAVLAEAPHAHLLVLVRGGAPQVWVDETRKADKTPAAIELPTGRHSVSVKGGQEFLPSEFNVELAPNDTQQMVFLSKTVAEAGRQRQQQGKRLAPGGRRGQGPNWDQVIRNLGFDPRAVRPDTLEPAQRRQFQKFMQRMDSARKANRPPPP